MARPRHGDFVAIVCIGGVLKLKYETIMSAAKLDQRIPIAAMKVMFCEYRTGTI